MTTTPFEDACWTATIHMSEYETLDFLSESAKRSLLSGAAKEMIASFNHDIEYERLMEFTWIAASSVKSHALGAVLSDSWATAFGREFTEKVREARERRVAYEKKAAKEREERDALYAQKAAERKAAEIDKAKRLLAENP